MGIIKSYIPETPENPKIPLIAKDREMVLILECPISVNSKLAK